MDLLSSVGSGLSSLGQSASSGFSSFGDMGSGVTQGLRNFFIPGDANAGGFNASQIAWDEGGGIGAPLRDPSNYGTMPWDEKLGALLSGGAQIPGMPSSRDAYLRNLAQMMMTNPIFRGERVEGTGSQIMQAFMPFMMAKLMTPATLESLKSEKESRELQKLMAAGKVEEMKGKQAFYKQKGLNAQAELALKIQEAQDKGLSLEEWAKNQRFEREQKAESAKVWEIIEKRKVAADETRADAALLRAQRGPTPPPPIYNILYGPDGKPIPWNTRELPPPGASPSKPNYEQDLKNQVIGPMLQGEIPAGPLQGMVIDTPEAAKELQQNLEGMSLEELRALRNQLQKKAPRAKP